jgi:hypothetical protein
VGIIALYNRNYSDITADRKMYFEKTRGGISAPPLATNCG